ncbi:hypothetical protein [Streptomyces sp. bgisy027]|uniref:hypothetical protein n=1 Tax=Streptomyces sp. bgisy027 TaxID=3413770 RepID=UPI003D71ED62
MLLLLFGGTAALQWTRREAAPSSLSEPRTTTDTTPSLSEVEKRCVTCVTHTPKTASDLPKQR